MIYLDTHVVAWLYAGEARLFSRQACELIESNDLFVSPIVLLELQYLYEIGRLKTEAATISENLSERVGLQLCRSPLMQVISEAMLQSWTRDPFDRMIVATAVSNNASLLTKDRTIRDHYGGACWD